MVVVPSGASARAVTVPLSSSVMPFASPSIFHVVGVLVPQPLASRTTALNANDSPVRRSFFDGRTSSRAGSPVVAHFGGGACVGVGAVVATGLSLILSKERDRFTSAMQLPAPCVIS